MTFIRKHKVVVILSTIFIVGLLLFVICLNFSLPKDENYKYGKRITGIEKFKIKDSIVDNIKDEIIKNNKVNKIIYRLDGRLIKFFIEVKIDSDNNNVENMLNVILDNFSEEEKGFYDLEVFITCEKKQGFYPMIAYKHRKNEMFTITKKEGSNDEK